MNYCFSDIPFTHLALYLLLSKKHNLKPNNPHLFIVGKRQRIKVEWLGTDINKKNFHDDLLLSEKYENAIDSAIKNL